MPKENLAVVAHVGPNTRGDKMSPPHALAGLAALGQPTRPATFQVLMGAEPHGPAAATISDKVGCTHNTLSSHLSILARSGLVRGARDGRSIIYRANVDAIRTLVGFLVDDCCVGHPELCHLQDAIDEANCGCAPAGKNKGGGRSRGK